MIEGRSGSRRSWAATALLLLGLWPGAARAEDPAASSTAGDAWIVTLGGTVSYGPSFEGAKTFVPYFMPSFDIRRADEPATFSAPDDSFGVDLFDFSGVKFGAVAGLRDARPYGVLPSVPGYNWALQAGVFAEFWPVDGFLRTRVELLQGLASDAGLAANLSADMVQKAGPFTFAIGPRMSLGDNTLMQTEFGITPAAALANGHLMPYEADAGIKSVGVSSSVSYDWSSDWTTTLYGSYQRLAGAAAASPLVTQGGNPNQLTIGLGFEHSFTIGH